MSTELRRIGLKGLLASVAIAGMTAGLATAQISANENASVPQMETLLEGQGIDVTNLQVAAGANQQYGSFTNGQSLINVGSGVYISTGRGANFSSSATIRSDVTNNGNTPDADLTALRSTATNDTAALQMTVTPAANTIKARMVFASEEYPEYVCSTFNDAFGLFVSGPGISGTVNFAQVPGSNTDISINTVNNGANNNGQVCPGETSNNSTLYNDNPTGASFIFDGYTDAIEVTMFGVTPGEDYVFKMAVADAIDTIYDSAVFVDFLESVWEHTADLSLDLTSSTPAPVIGQNFTITATINNAGPEEVPFFKVADILPAGLTFVSASGDGTYDDTNDEWSSTASIAANSTMTMTLTVNATAAGTYTTASEVIEQWSDDVDSTPNDGEGDDYDTLSITTGIDRSDAPASAPTYGEATHNAFLNVRLGSAIDSDIASIANADASGDGADDDGVFANAGLSTGLQGEAFQQEDGSILYVPVVGTGALYAWADWDQDGTFGNNANEIIANGITGSDETLVVPFSVPLTALNGQTFMRFRWSSDVAAASPTGLAADGEVEDYAVTIGGSVTPAPTPSSCSAGFLTQSWAASGGGYASTTSDGLIVTANASAPAGASWSFAPNDALNSAGEFGDPSINGITSLSTVYSWDTTPEDGRNANAADDAQTGQLSFSFSEYVRDPIFYIDRVGGYGGSEAATPQALSNSILITSNSLPLTRLAGVDHLEVTSSTVGRTPNETMVFGEGTSESGTDRTRNTAMGAVQVTGTFDTVAFDVTGIGVEGAGGDGVEFVWCAQLAEDYQDAPAIYGVASHVYDPNVRLGFGLDAEAGSLASVDATGDGGDDDGVTLPTLTHGLASTISVDVTGAGYLQAWIDFDGNNSFGGSGEQIASDVQDGGVGDTDGVANGTIVLSVTPPANGFTGTSYARFRWSTDTGLSSTGSATDGEVEDYAVIIRDLDELAFTPDQRRTVIPGTVVLYPHTLYVPEDLSGGTLAFAQTSDQSLNWTIWRDVDASGDLSAADVQWVNGATLPATGELGFIVQAQIAGTVPAGWRDISEFTVTVTLGSQTRSSSVTDVTDVSGLDAGTLTAAKFLAIDSDCDGALTDETASNAAFEIGKQGLPGTCVVYRITFRNDSTAAVTEVIVRDMVPAWTTYVAGSANYETVPSGMTAGTATEPTAGQRGALAFPFTGSLAAGADGAVSYEVKIDE